MKYFDYKTVAAVVSERLFDDLDKVAELVSYMTGREVTRDSAPALMRVCRVWFMGRFPALRDMDWSRCSPFYYDCYLADFFDILGPRVAVPSHAAALRQAA